MPHYSLWFPDDRYNRKDVKEFIQRVANVAEDLGYITHGGPMAGRGNVRALLEAIVRGDVECTRISRRGRGGGSTDDV